MLGPLSMIKVDIANGFYWINLTLEDIPKLGVMLPTRGSQQLIVALPLVLPMGWKNNPPIFTSATETVPDLANAKINNFQHEVLAHHLDDQAAQVPPTTGATFSSSLQIDTLLMQDTLTSLSMISLL